LICRVDLVGIFITFRKRKLLRKVIDKRGGKMICLWRIDGFCIDWAAFILPSIYWIIQTTTHLYPFLIVTKLVFFVHSSLLYSLLFRFCLFTAGNWMAQKPKSILSSIYQTLSFVGSNIISEKYVHENLQTRSGGLFTGLDPSPYRRLLHCNLK